MRGAKAVGWVLALWSCASCGVANQRAREDAAMFDFLTSSAWEGGGCHRGDPLPPTCVTLTFDRSGHFSWRAVSDYLERDEKGRWNFTLRDATSGVITLENGSVLDFAREEERLSFAGAGFQAAPGGVLPETSGSVEGLAELTPSALYRSLVSTPWAKTNPFDEFYEPDTLVFGRDGQLRASYRAGQCEHGGKFSVDGKSLIQVRESNACDLRGASSVTSFIDSPRMRGDLLAFFQSSYRPATQAEDPKLFLHDGYQDSLELRGEYGGTLARGSPVDLQLTFTNEGTIAQTLTSVEISMRALALGRGSLSTTGQATLLASEVYQLPVQSGDSLSQSVRIVPSDRGEYVELQVVWQFKDVHQSYRSVLQLVGPVQ